MAKKKRPPVGVPGEAGGKKKRSREFQAHDTQEKREQMRKKLKISQLERSLEKEEQKLRNWSTEAASSSQVSKKSTSNKRHGGVEINPEKWKLRGPARPWAEVQKIADGEAEGDNSVAFALKSEAKATDDLFQKFQGSFSKDNRTLEYLRLQLQIAETCVELDQSRSAIHAYEKCLELDKEDTLKARHGLVIALLDDGQAAEARDIIDKHPEDKGTVFAFSLAFIEFVAWKIVREEDASEEIARKAFIKAHETNPHVAPFIAGYDVFHDVVEFVEEITDVTDGSVEEAFTFVSRTVGLWLDTEGAQDFVLEMLQSLPPHECSDSCCDDEMYGGMYNTAIEMIIEAEKETQQEETSVDK